MTTAEFVLLTVAIVLFMVALVLAVLYDNARLAAKRKSEWADEAQQRIYKVQRERDFAIEEADRVAARAAREQARIAGYLAATLAHFERKYDNAVVMLSRKDLQRAKAKKVLHTIDGPSGTHALSLARPGAGDDLMEYL